MTILALALLALAPAQEKGGIMDRLKFDAEGRMRAEATLDNVDAATGNDIDDRYRGRMRFRFGAKYALMEDMNVVGRLSTASDGNDANNPHWDFGDGDGFNGSGVVMDRFYLDWTANEEIHVMAGKQPHAFVMPPIYSDFLWDNDISPSGFSASWKPKIEEGSTSFDARVAAYVATEVATDEDPNMWGAQGNIYVPLDEGKAQLSTALYDWSDNGTTGVAGNQGNSATTEDFNVWDTFLSGTFQGGPLEEMTGYVEFMNNLGESEQGWVAGAQLGSSQWQQGNFNVFALLYDLEGDSLFSPVSQDDTPIAGTGLNDGDGDGTDGVVLGGQYFWRDNVAVKFWVLTSDPSGADDEPLRVRIDLDFKVK
ncbi:MAG: hypothetical protein HOP15_08510 [Planctomycetes bacterium]|nr:hypothetical protein [Planctomycetota bacterium]